MVALFQFQADAVNTLLEQVRYKNKITLKSPTGSGKTIILAHFINEYLNLIDDTIRFIWLCPGNGELEQQSKDKVHSEFQSLKVFDLNDALSNGFVEGSITFINWEAVSKTNNRSITESEFDNLYDKFQKVHTANDNHPKFIFIIDEAHLNIANNSLTNATVFLNRITQYCISQIHVSATPYNAADIEINEIDVINSGLITKLIEINTAIPQNLTLTNASEEFEVISNNITKRYNNEYEYLIDLAEKKRIQIQNAYKALNKNINPLVVVQFPNGLPSVIQIVKDYLSSQYGYDVTNDNVAEYFSGSGNNGSIHTNLNGITKNDAPQKYLLFKQAIATGWDCLRAKILVKLREKGNSTFEIQTVGRIRRMPEAKHYGLDILDNCFVYTLDSKYLDGLREFNQTRYVNQLSVKTNLQSQISQLLLKKENRDPNYATSIGETDILKILYEFFKSKYNLTNVANNFSSLIQNQYISSKTINTKVITGSTQILNTHNLKSLDYITIHKHPNMYYSRIQFDSAIHEFSKIIGLNDNQVRKVILHLFCTKQSLNGSGISKHKILSLSQNDVMTFVINNRDKLKSDISKAVSQFISCRNFLKIITPIPSSSDFYIPLHDVIKYDNNVTKKQLSKNVYEGYSTQNCSNLFRSQTEIEFEQFCEQCKNVEWVYKNGDVGNNYFSILYQDTIMRQFLFYPDYIVKVNGDIWIVEIKGGIKTLSCQPDPILDCHIQLSNGAWIENQNIDKHSEQKFNALKNYLIKNKLKGGFIRKNQSGILCIAQTSYTEDMSGIDIWDDLNSVWK